MTPAPKIVLDAQSVLDSKTDLNAKSFLNDCFAAALKAAAPENCVPAFLPPPPKGRTIVIGAGKAAASMAKAVEDHFEAQGWGATKLQAISGLVVTRYHHGLPTRHIEVVEASHPVPDAEGLQAAQRILEMVSGLTADDLVIFLASGGASALLALPPNGITLDEKRALSSQLLKSGASIHEINTVRKHLSRIKGGRLAQAASPAHVVTLVISDVAGDDLSVIGSGPTVADPSTFADALAVLQRYNITPAASISQYLNQGAEETPKPGCPSLANATAQIICTPDMALRAAAQLAEQHGIKTLILGDTIEGEAREVARCLGGIAKSVRLRGLPVSGPCLILSGGETTVTVRGNGQGGRNAEFLLGLSIFMDGMDGVYALACDTDGIDGVEDNAGAIMTPDTLDRAAKLGLSATGSLSNNDAYGFFKALDDLVFTGPTRTNVNDFRAILVM